jgi:fermentation-respiration switch protein FrsA (DUF1100 family)
MIEDTSVLGRLKSTPNLRERIKLAVDSIDSYKVDAWDRWNSGTWADPRIIGYLSEGPSPMVQ